MKSLPTIFLFASAGALAAAPAFYDGFACPGSYTDGQNLTEAAAKEGAIQWKAPDKMEKQEAGAFVVRKPAEAAPATPVSGVEEDKNAAREERAKKRKEMRDKYRQLPRESAKKAQEADELAAKGHEMVEKMKNTPGKLEMVAGQKANQGLRAALKKPLSPPYYFSFLLEPDKKAGGPLTISLEDAKGDAPVEMILSSGETLIFKVNTTGNFMCRDMETPLFIVGGVEQNPKDRKQWFLRLAANPTDNGDPLGKASVKYTMKMGNDPAEVVAFGITKGGRVMGFLDEIRVGTNVREVMP